MDEILITGVSGGLANLVAYRLADEFKIVGVDVRPRRQPEPFPGKFYQVRYQTRGMAEIFRRHRFRALLHLGRLRNTVSSLKERFDLNVFGTKNLLELCLRHELEQIVVMSTYHVYGAHQHNPMYLSEEHPLRASQIFPQLADAVALDNVVQAFLWRNRRIKTLILRPSNIVGPNINNATCTLMRQKVTPYLWGFNPTLQYVYQNDVAEAIEMTVKSPRWGIYNLAGEGVIPYVRSIEVAGGTPVPVPHFVAYPAVGALSRLGLRFPMHLLDYFKYPTIVSDERFREDFGFKPKIDTIHALQSIRRS